MRTSSDRPGRSRLIKWDVQVRARAAVVHAGETRGQLTLLRREGIVLPDGRLVQVPIVSGNHVRGRLRRVGEELLRDVLEYEGQLSVAAAHMIRGGGALVKATGEPLSGSRLARIRSLIPQLAVFGAAGGGTIISGALDVSKLVPHMTETDHLTGSQSRNGAFQLVQIEQYARQDDSRLHDFVGVVQPTFDASGAPVEVEGNQMVFQLETLPAGTVFSGALWLRRPTELEIAFFRDVLETWQSDAVIGGRTAMGHGRVDVDISVVAGDPAVSVDWRAHVRAHRDEILELLNGLG